jgi:adenine-specific DNA-methyltransferase
LEAFDGQTEVANAEAHLDKVIRLLKASGVDFPGNKNMNFSRLDPVTGASLIHAEGEWVNGDKKDRRVAVSIGPEVGNVSAMQVEDVIRDANRKGYPSEQNARRSSHSDDAFDADQVELCWNCYFSLAYLDRQILA